MMKRLDDAAEALLRSMRNVLRAANPDRFLDALRKQHAAYANFVAFYDFALSREPALKDQWSFDLFFREYQNLFQQIELLGHSCLENWQAELVNYQKVRATIKKYRSGKNQEARWIEVA